MSKKSLKTMKVLAVNDRKVSGISLDGMTNDSFFRTFNDDLVMPGDIVSYCAEKNSTEKESFVYNLTTDYYLKYTWFFVDKMIYGSIIFAVVFLYFTFVFNDAFRVFYFACIACGLLLGGILRRLVKNTNEELLAQVEQERVKAKDAIEKSIENRKKLAAI